MELSRLTASVVPDLRGSYTALYEGTKDDLVPDQQIEGGRTLGLGSRRMCR